MGFCKNWGMTARVKVMLHPMVGVGITSRVPKMEGNFLSKCFTSLGTESGMGCVGVGSAAGKTESGGFNMD